MMNALKKAQSVGMKSAALAAPMSGLWMQQ